MRSLSDTERKTLDWVRRGDFAECEAIALPRGEYTPSISSLYERQLVTSASAPAHLADRFDVVHVLTARGELALRVDAAVRKAGVVA